MEIHLPVRINQGNIIKLALLVPGIFQFKVEPFNAKLITLLNSQVPLPPVLVIISSKSCSILQPTITISIPKPITSIHL